jgi:hypothetical protein
VLARMAELRAACAELKTHREQEAAIERHVHDRFKALVRARCDLKRTFEVPGEDVQDEASRLLNREETI